MTAQESETETCCCGHGRDQHTAGFGMCFICKHHCDRFHAAGEGPCGLAPRILFAVLVAIFILVVVAGVLTLSICVWNAIAPAHLAVVKYPWRLP